MHPAWSMPLRSGEGIAALGHGTRYFAESPAGRAEEVASVRLGVDLEMTVIDTAEMYSNGAAEALVGEAISGGHSEEFLVAKVLRHHVTRVGTVRAYEASLGGLGVEDIDLYLPHWRGGIPLVETIEGFAELELTWRVQHGIPTMAYSPIEQGRPLECPALQTIAQRHGAAPAHFAPAAKAPPSCDGGVRANNAGEMA
jgi:diketogulonate reductase-like aldo/keto reductase